MKIRYGGYEHDTDECSIQIGTQNERSGIGIVQSSVTTVTISGMLQAASVSALTTALRELETAYSVDGRDLGLYTDAGVSTAHVWIAGQCDSIRVISPPSYPVGDGAEYTTFRRYQIVIEIRKPVAGGSEVVEWSQRIEEMGDGGPVILWIPCYNGPPVRQEIQPSSTRKIIQSGQAVGRTGYPTPPAPIYPEAVKRDSSRISRESPKMVNPSRYFAVQWQYEMEML